MTCTDVATEHPAHEQLLAFGQGKLAAADSLAIEQHLESCPDCCDTLLELRDDTFSTLVREAGPAMDELAAWRDHPRYRLLERIGRGGMGSVYRAEHRVMRRPVAIKVIRSELLRHPQAAARFHREVQAAARLSHPNIVAAYDAEQAGDAHCLVMEFVDGTDLATLVHKAGPLPITTACDAIRQAAAGLQHAHEQGMIHRDIKPHNLIRSIQGQVRILDFGLAGFRAEDSQSSPDSRNTLNPTCEPHHGKENENESANANANEKSLTTLDHLIGTPDYMAPEQARDAHAADIRSDIYSLGCTLVFLLTGQPPFAAETIRDKITAHTDQPPPDLRKLRPEIPIELSRVVAQMLAKNPAERFATPAAVEQALASLVAPRRSSLPPFGKWLAGFALAGFVLLAGLIVVVTDRGQLEIESEVEDVQVVVKQGGKQVEVLDVKTGSQMKWLPGGDYELQVVGRENDVQLDKNSLTMSRLGKVIVTARWKTGDSSVFKTFTAEDKPITKDGVTVADGGWKITADKARSVALFEVPAPKLAPGRFFYRAKVKCEKLAGRSYLEMWNRFPGIGEAFSKGLDHPIQGDTEWTEREVQFFLRPGEQPDLIKLNIVVEGAGTVWIKDIELRGHVVEDKP